MYNHLACQQTKNITSKQKCIERHTTSPLAQIHKVLEYLVITIDCPDW